MGYLPTFIFKPDASVSELTEKRETPVPYSEQHCIWSAGVITNRKQLSDSLAVPASLSDSELLGHAYKTSQEASFARIKGSCSWIIWDQHNHSLYAIVGRSGAFTLYYRKTDSGFLIASQVESLMQDGRCTINRQSLKRYLSGIPLPETITHIQEVRSIPSGEYVTFTGERSSRKLYSSLVPWKREYRGIDDCAEVLRNTIFETVDQYLTDGPCAIAISSGLDSTSVAAVIRTIRPDAHLIGCIWRRPDGADGDEADLAIKACDHLGLEKLIIDDESKGPLIDGMHQTCARPRHSLFYDAFWGDVLQELQKRDVRQLFTGIGGDELFGANFFIFPELLLHGRWLELMRQLQLTGPRTPRDWAQRLWRLTFAPIVAEYIPSGYHQLTGHPNWLTFTPPKKPDFSEHYEHSRSLSFSQRQRYHLLWSLGRQGTRGDGRVNAARFGIRQHLPLLDHRMKEFALSIPSKYLCTGEGMKRVLRRAMMNDLPAEIIQAPRKRLPSKYVHNVLVEWGEQPVRDLLQNMRCAEQGLVNEDKARIEYDRYLKAVKSPATTKSRPSTMQASHFLRLLAVEAWLRKFW